MPPRTLPLTVGRMMIIVAIVCASLAAIRYLFVPEPSSMVLMGFGVVGLVWAGRARRPRLQPSSLLSS